MSDFALGDPVRVIANGRRGRVTQVTEGQITVLVQYQQGAVELAEAFAPADLEAAE